MFFFVLLISVQNYHYQTLFMTKIKPFRGYFPKSNLGAEISTKPLNTYSDEEIQQLMKRNSNSFLHIILHDEKERKMELNDRFSKTKQLFEESIENGNFEKSATESFYVYRQSGNGKSYCGIIGGAFAEDYQNGKIKKHELTLKKREKLFTKYLTLTGFNAEPVLLVYPKKEAISALIENTMGSTPIHDFTSEDNLHHQLWEISNKKDIELIESNFSEIPNIYIADGHHRSASSNRLSLLDRGKESKQYIMSLLMSDEDVHIYDFNRVIKNSEKLSFEEIKEKLSKEFSILEESDNLLSPREKHEFTIYLFERWIRIKLIKVFNPNSGIIEQLDSQIITDSILAPIFDIKELTKDKRVNFVPGNKGLDSLQDKVDNGKYDIAIAMYPVSFGELKLIADNDLIMPPKSTYIEPKLRSGLTVYKF